PAHQRQIVVIGLQGWSVDARTCNAEYSPARATPPTQSSPSLPGQFSVSFCSSSSAPSVATERLQIQLVNWSQIRGPFHDCNGICKKRKRRIKSQLRRTHRNCWAGRCPKFLKLTRPRGEMKRPRPINLWGKRGRGQRVT